MSRLNRTWILIPFLLTQAALAQYIYEPPPEIEPVELVPEKGLWWNPAENGTGYNFDIKHGVLVMSMFTYEATGHSEWYVAAGPLTDNGTKFSGTLDKYRGGQCLVCSYTGRPTLAGNDGTVGITFTSPTSAIITLPGNRVSHIQPQVF